MRGYSGEGDPTYDRQLRFAENISLVYFHARKFSTPVDPALSTEDTIQAGMEGLWKACLDFDPNMGYEFSTYASLVIRGQILRQFRHLGALKMPRKYLDFCSVLRKYNFTIPLSDDQIEVLIKDGKYSREQIMKFSSMEVEVLSLDKPIDEESRDSKSMSEIVSDPKGDVEEQYFCSEDGLEYIIQEAVKCVRPSYRDLVEEWMYSTIYEGKAITQEELGAKYGKSQAQVSRILKQSVELIKLKGLSLKI